MQCCALMSEIPTDRCIDARTCSTAYCPLLILQAVRRVGSSCCHNGGTRCIGEVQYNMQRGYQIATCTARCVSQAQNAPELTFSPLRAPGPLWESLRRFPRPSRLGRDTPSPHRSVGLYIFFSTLAASLLAVPPLLFIGKLGTFYASAANEATKELKAEELKNLHKQSSNRRRRPGIQHLSVGAFLREPALPTTVLYAAPKNTHYAFTVPVISISSLVDLNISPRCSQFLSFLNTLFETNVSLCIATSFNNISVLKSFQMSLN